MGCHEMGCMSRGVWCGARVLAHVLCGLVTTSPAYTTSHGLHGLLGGGMGNVELAYLAWVSANSFPTYP